MYNQLRLDVLACNNVVLGTLASQQALVRFCSFSMQPSSSLNFSAAIDS